MAELLEDVGSTPVTQAFTQPAIKNLLSFVNIRLTEVVERDALGYELTDEAIRVLITAAFARRVRMTIVDLRSFDAVEQGKLRAVIKGD
ncbi:hypothetical protein BVJ53_05920 [Lacticaseibacillus chiayiensis]|uniref:Uncharacterized protein n=1 Tax=Lacticaseibacillus chiayiensis TaxID=2100821 RepID=A0A4Q1U790_9LACO|nr:hypothetical protein BVJ53_05920 [Lacticaseibacillus chiayiensis]